jgi:hypothetical protein
MSNIQFYDVIVAKEFETNVNGKLEKRTTWNKVGRAWNSKTNDSMSFEIFLLPGIRYVINMKERDQKTVGNEETPF